MSKSYSENFYKYRHNNTLYSAQVIMSITQNLVNPASVVDVGCGVGTWLKVIQDLGVDDVLGIEGEWVDKGNIVIPPSKFVMADITKPINIDRKFDLAVSLEVAEHIEERYTEQYLENLTSLAPVILFSAAIPLQGGANHVNEQWPEYWQQKFEKHGYVIIDCIRNKVWSDHHIEMWYAQNSFIYVQKDKLNEYQKLKNDYKDNANMLAVVHPRFYQHKIKTLPILKAIRYKCQRLFKKHK